MKVSSKIAALAFALGMLIPSFALANNQPSDTHLAHVPQTFRTGKITSISSPNIVIHGTNNIDYTVNSTDAKLIRRLGAPMAFSEMQVNDTVKVRGMLSGTTINAVQIQDESLQQRNGTFTGTVSSLIGNGFILQSKARGSQTINYSTSTQFRLGTASTSMATVAVGQTVTVSGVWDRTNANVTAKKVVIKIKNITVNGTIVAKSDTQLTVNGTDSKNYTVDITKAKIYSKNNAKLTPAQINLNDSVKVQGTAIVGFQNITAKTVKDKTNTTK